MPILVLQTRIDAPVERCFDAARDIGLHCKTNSRTREKVIAGVRTGLIGFNDTVTFEAVHLGFRRKLTSRITEFNRPTVFVDQMQRGPFKSLKHTHEFRASEDGTVMVDMLEWTSPFGIIGSLTDKLILCKYMRRILEGRNSELKRAIECKS